MCVTHVGPANHAGEGAGRGLDQRLGARRLGSQGQSCGPRGAAARRAPRCRGWARKWLGRHHPSAWPSAGPRSSARLSWPRPQDRNPGGAPPSAAGSSGCRLREGPFAGETNCPVSAAHGPSMSVDPEGPIDLLSPINRRLRSSPFSAPGPMGATLRSKSWAALTPTPLAGRGDIYPRK